MSKVENDYQVIFNFEILMAFCRMLPFLLFEVDFMLEFILEGGFSLTSFVDISFQFAGTDTTTI